MTQSNHVPIYPRFNERSIWSNMKQRCYNPKNPAYERYGGRGIIVCDRWKYSFDNFYYDLGPRPGPHHSVERRDTDGNYEPNNCHWGTAKEQQNNTSRNKFVFHENEKLTLSQLSDRINIDYNTLHARFSKGLTGKELVSPVTSAQKYLWRNSLYSIRELSEISGESIRTLSRRIKQGFEVEEAIRRTSLQLSRDNSFTYKENLIDYEGGKITFGDLSEKTGIKLRTLYSRFRRGLTGSNLITPVTSIPTYALDGNEYTLMELSELSGISPSTLLHRLFKQKLSVEAAVIPPSGKERVS